MQKDVEGIREQRKIYIWIYILFIRVKYYLTTILCK